GLPTAFAATLLAVLLTVIAAAIGDRSFLGYYPAKWWARIICWCSLVRVTVKGRENIDRKQGYMFVANHQGAYDIFAVYGWLGHNFRWMMKQSLRKIPLIGYACARIGHIMVDNHSPAAVRRTIDTARATLRDGMSIVIFPEGARTFTGKVGPFKKGAYQLALEFGLPIVPITIDGAFKVMPRTTLIPRPGHIKLTIHKPIPAPHSDDDRTEAMQLTRDTIISALPYA
ncbi:MAG: 1-acyl-sn-glycerol-3-phosphate acyltransferase, partial [Muribaculaceae bacterium]|nr:1-acyl-sn-glycerol-3-phosphate acyltransferase [Muribaculaceae bacterium]